MSTGKVKFLNEEKGFGMITDDATGEDIFLRVPHKDTIREGDNVVYDISNGPKGLIAVNVKVI